jgi:hypothetical protein
VARGQGTFDSVIDYLVRRAYGDPARLLDAIDVLGSEDLTARALLNRASRRAVLVDLRLAAPKYFVMPEWWIKNDIYDAHADYLAAHGGVRPGKPDSLHHAIPVARVDQWRDRWDVLGIFGDDGT